MTLPADLNALLDDLRPAIVRDGARGRRARRVRITAAMVVAAAFCAGVAFAADHFLGEPAPPSVQADVHGMASGFIDQPGLQAQTARIVATTPDATLYGVYDDHGTYCVELVGAARGLIFGTTCALGFGVGGPNAYRGAVSLPQANVIVDGVAPPVVVYGKLAAGAVSAEAVLGDGSREPVSIGLGGFWVYEPSEVNQPVARRLPINIEEHDAAGRTVWTAYFQPPLPLASEGTPVGKLSGRVEIDGAAKIVVRNQAGFHRPQTIMLGNDGSFTWTRPPDMTEPALIDLTVLDKNGHLLAEAEPVPEQAWRHWLTEARGQ